MSRRIEGSWPIALDPELYSYRVHNDLEISAEWGLFSSTPVVSGVGGKVV